MLRVRGLVWPIVLSIVLPLVAAWFAYPETHVPPGFGIFRRLGVLRLHTSVVGIHHDSGWADISSQRWLFVAGGPF